MKPLAEIIRLYEPSLVEQSSIEVDYASNQENSLNQDQLERLTSARDSARNIIEQKRTDLGIAHIKPLNLDKTRADTLRAAIKNDPQWREAFQEIVAILAPTLKEVSIEDKLGSIQVPWWNGSILSLLGDEYNPLTSSLHLDASLSHSYVAQLMNSGKLPKISQDLMSVSGILITADEKVILGLRGGHRYSDTLMTLPAGSIEYHTGKNPLFETFYDEHKDETNLELKDLSSVELLGRVFDHTISRNSLYVFKACTNLSFSELQKRWLVSSDQAEHKALIALDNDPNSILRFISDKTYDPSKADSTNPAATTLENRGSVLPPCAVSLLLYCIHEKGLGWREEAQTKVREKYKL